MNLHATSLTTRHIENTGPTSPLYTKRRYRNTKITEPVSRLLKDTFCQETKMSRQKISHNINSSYYYNTTFTE